MTLYYHKRPHTVRTRRVFTDKSTVYTVTDGESNARYVNARPIVTHDVCRQMSLPDSMYFLKGFYHSAVRLMTRIDLFKVRKF